MPPPAPTVTVKTEQERAAHPDFCGPTYEELHEQVKKHMQNVMALWPKKKGRHEVQVANTEVHPLVKNGDAWKATKALLDEC